MNYKNIIKKQSFIITVSIVVMGIILIGTSYALFTKQNNSNTQVVASGTLSINYSGTTITTTGGTDGGGNLLEIEPLDEATVDSQSPYTIVVNNTGTLAMRYNVVLYTDETNTLPHNYYAFKYKDNGSYTTKAVLTSLPKVDNTVTQMNSIKYNLTSTPFVIEPGATNTHEIHVWIDEDYADENISNKIANLKIAVEGEATGSELPYTLLSGNLDTVGSEVRIANEDFYVIGQEDATHVKLLAKWNLNVGANAKGTATGLQDPEVRGYRKDGGTQYGNIEFASSAYWIDENNQIKPEYGSSSPTYVYTNTKENGVYLASIAEYVDNYVTYLTNQGVNVTGRLMKRQELWALVNNGSSISGSTNLTESASDITGKEWVYQDSYWLSDGSGSGHTMYVNSSSHYSATPCTTSNIYGARPVIILEK